MNHPKCFNCGTRIGDEQRVCHSCGQPHWYECEWCSDKFSTITIVAFHKLECSEKPPEKGLFDY
jgi:predicted amidophosphoribosyltransferase